jgi:hypothetical protein
VHTQVFCNFPLAVPVSFNGSKNLPVSRFLLADDIRGEDSLEYQPVSKLGDQ